MSGEHILNIPSVPPPASPDYQGLLSHALYRIGELEKQLSDLRAADAGIRLDVQKLTDSVADISKSLESLKLAAEEDRRKLDTIMAAMAEQKKANDAQDKRLEDLTTKVVGIDTKQDAIDKKQDALAAKQDANTTLLTDIKDLFEKNKWAFWVALTCMTLVGGCVSGCVNAIGPRVAPQFFESITSPPKH